MNLNIITARTLMYKEKPALPRDIFIRLYINLLNSMAESHKIERNNHKFFVYMEEMNHVH